MLSLSGLPKGCQPIWEFTLAGHPCQNAFFPALNGVWHTSEWQLSGTRCSMTLWHRKEPFSRLQAWTKWSLIILHSCAHYYGSPLTARGTNRHVRWANQKDCEKIADLNSPPPEHRHNFADICVPCAHCPIRSLHVWTAKSSWQSE